MIGHTLTRHLTGLVSLLPWFSSRLLLVRPHPALTGAPTGERIRDKIAASKRKGIWMGGVPPLGYDVDKRLLVVNDTEAAVVRRIFEEMRTIGSPTQIAANLTLEGITTKTWTTQDGQPRHGAQIDKKYLHKLLRNRIYLGELSH